MAGSGSITVGWCTGKDCRKSDRTGELRAIAAERCDLVELKCLDLCDGAVVVVRPASDDASVFHEVRRRGVVRDIVEYAIDGVPLSPRAKKRRIDGTKRTKALRRVERRT